MKKQYTLAAALLFLGGATIGGLASQLFLQANRPLGNPSNPSILQSKDALGAQELGAALHELSQTLGALQDSLELQRNVGALPEPTRLPASGNDPQPASDPGLSRALVQLAKAIEGMPRGGASPIHTTSNLLASAGHKNRFEAFRSKVLLESRLAEGDHYIWERAHAAFLQKHMFWSYEDLLNAYGRPDEINTHDQGTEWYYRVRVHEGYEEEFYFNFHDGLLIGVNYDLDVL